MSLKFKQLMDRQLELESQMVGLGHRKIMIQVIEGRSILNASGIPVHAPGARESQQESHTSYGNSLIVNSIDLVAHAILDYLLDTGASRHSTVKKLFRQFLDTARHRKHLEITQCRIIAFVALQSLIDSISSKHKHTAAAVSIGRSLESELRFRHFSLKNPALWDTINRDLLKKKASVERRKMILAHSMYHDGSGKTAGWVGWNSGECAAAGAQLLEVIRATTNLVEFRMHTIRKNRTMLFIEPTNETQRYMEEKLDTAGIRFPVFLPSLVTPNPWVSPTGGGYFSSFEALKPVRLVKIAFSARAGVQLKKLFAHQDEMTGVYDAVNAVQSTPWRINQGVYAVMQQAWKSGGMAIGKMPQYTDADTLASAFPLEPFNEAMRLDPDALTQFKRDRAKVYSSRIEQSSRVIQQMRMMTMAEMFVGEERIYFPTQLDFRGRMYAMPNFLSPQGTDCAKGLLEFVRPHRLGATGLKWLQIHVANMAGIDKVSFQAREEWTMEHYEDIKQWVQDPFVHRAWMDLDTPWQFLAGAMELVACVESGQLEDYHCSLPVSVDGTCNGLQHFAAMTRDKIGGAAVNLLPSEDPKDIYQLVADKVKEKLRGMSDPLAAQWLEYGFDRKATKRCVMILPYSGTLHSAHAHIVEYIKERKQRGPWDSPFKAATFLATMIWTTIEETVPAAVETMRWLKEVSDRVSQAGLTLQWKTSLGFPVEQDNRKRSQFRINMMLGQGIRYTPVLSQDDEQLDPAAQRLGISPNFIHSMDALCLMLTVNRAVDAGIHDFHLVHDSFGCPAGQMETFFHLIRESFVEIYEEPVLEDFLTDVTRGLDPLVIAELRRTMPQRGSLDIKEVLKSNYFFA